MPSKSTLKAKAARIRLLLFDVDGVLTDGRIVLPGDGTETKAFHVRDGAGIVYARHAGLEAGFLSARQAAATAERAAQLGVRLVVQAKEDKLEAYTEILRRRKLTDEQVAYMGDDLLDLPVLARAGLSAAPADAAPEVRARVDFVAKAPGGHGAARELVELVLGAQGAWARIVAGAEADRR